MQEFENFILYNRAKNLSAMIKILENDKGLFKRLKLYNLKFINSGGYGEVWGDKDFAYKLSWSTTEAKYCKKIIGRRFKHVVEIKDVYKPRRCPFYIIKMERLKSKRLSINCIDDHKHVKAGNKTLKRVFGKTHPDIHYNNVLYDPRKKVYKLIDLDLDLSGSW